MPTDRWWRTKKAVDDSRQPHANTASKGVYGKFRSSDFSFTSPRISVK